jgi:hypothetical protein
VDEFVGKIKDRLKNARYGTLQEIFCTESDKLMRVLFEDF